MKVLSKKKIFWFAVIPLFFFFSFLLTQKSKPRNFLIGVFLSDRPNILELERFRANYGKMPDIVMVFVDWGKFVDQDVVSAACGRNIILLVTWEPWDAAVRKGIDYNGLIRGSYDDYISDFALRIKGIGSTVMIRFAHEQNGNWYPWSGSVIGDKAYINMYRHVKDIFDREAVNNARWIYSVNWEDVPAENNFLRFYPGDGYVDYVGIDGYNWGTTQGWGRWMEFGDIFTKRYAEIINNIPKPVLISEFGSSSQGGDRPAWIKNAFKEISGMKEVEGAVLFNMDKEADWGFKYGTRDAAALKDSIRKYCR